MRLLVIEDNEPLADLIVKILRSTYQVDLCGTFDDAAYLTGVATYGAIILDLGLPDGDGIDLCRLLRRNNIGIPILVLTARLDKESHVAALDAGADDYVTKPFHTSELLARVRALLRRPALFSGAILSGGNLTLDPATRQVRHDDLLIPLRRKEFDLLEYLMRHPGQALSRSRLLDQIWENEGEAATNTVDVHIKYLRDHVDRPFQTHHIQTVHGIGYSFVTTLRE